MVVSTAKQLDSTYLLWQRFTYPSENGPRDAVAVPSWVGDQLNAAYALIIEMTVVHLWSIIIGLAIYFYMQRHQMEPSNFSPMVPTIWNKRADLLDSIIETVTSPRDGWKTPRGVLLLLLILAAWIGQMATGVIVPPLIILDHAAPVNPDAIYVPDRSDGRFSALAALFDLEAPRMLRALGSIAVDDEIRKRVDLSPAKPEGTTDDGEDILRFDYKYNATGTDFGLQQSQDLTLNVEGSCVTEYGWHNQTERRISGRTPFVVDYYIVFEELIDASLFDGRQPSARFLIRNETLKGSLVSSNATWAIVVSSVNRTSFSPGTDPWYLTGTGIETETGAEYQVMPARPVLSCWEDNVWSYEGRNSTVEFLTSGELPGLKLSPGLGDIFTSILGSPMIQRVGQHLQASALASATTANGQLFNARGSSIYTDLERLVQTAFVVTVNTLTDLTLYPAGADRELTNTALDASGQVQDGVADFVVWSPDVAALSVLVIIVVPSLFIGTWLLAAILLYWTPIRAVNRLDSNQEHQNLNDIENPTPMGEKPGAPVNE